MPYKDPKHKAEWERRHRARRIARRRELRRIEAARELPDPTTTQTSLDGPIWPFVGVSGALAFSNPWLGLGAGSLTFTVAALRKAHWRWWVIGALTVILSIFVLWTRNVEQET